jgi:Helix-turn-helix domain/RodZ C-terminal domain
MAPQVGQALREARTERGIELGEVERATKIRIRFLRAMEEDRWEELPAPAYARGFISAYARFLGLDEGALVDQYRSTVEGAARPEPIPSTVLHRGEVSRGRSVRPVVILVAGLAAVALLGLVIVGALGGSGSGGGEDHGGGKAARSAGKAATTTSATGRPSAPASAVSVELHSTDVVWVCLVDAEGRTEVNGETLAAGETRGPFDSRSFAVTFGNGSVELTVDGEPAKVPAVVEPLGYRITPSGVHRLDPSSRPTCL